MTGCAELEDSWQVRVCDVRGNTVGAGVLVGTGQVLTCAHVVRDAGVTVTGDPKSQAPQGGPAG